MKDTLLRGIALLGLIVVLVLGAWGIILLAFNLPNVLSSVGNSVSSLFVAKNDTVEVPVVTIPTTPTTPVKPTTSVKQVTPTTNQPSYVYQPAATVAPQLWGLPDLSVRILSITPQPAPTYASGGGRYSMQFEVINVGTNVARSGWTFNAVLPLEPQYTFSSQAQQALNPGDRIVYTLGFDMPYGTYNQYNNYNYQYQNCGYTYNGYQNYWDCPTGSYNYNYQYPNYNYGNRVVTINVDPWNMLYEQNRSNNTASQILNYNYTTYPQYPWAY